ncbi:MAG: hypothetical protein U0W40_03365 [Acidimicrobiia bacterium]
MTDILGHLEDHRALLTSEVGAVEALRSELPELRVLVAVGAPALAGWLDYDELLQTPASPATIAERRLGADGCTRSRCRRARLRARRRRCGR